MSDAPRILGRYFDPHGPGAALGIATDGQPPRVACLGLADVEAKLPITPETAFDLASGGKTFTAVGVMLLAGTGDVDLSAPVRDYVPTVETPVSGRDITLRDLLQHTSDLPDYLEHGMYTAAELATPASVDDRLAAWSRDARPGTSHAYSNTNYIVLSRVIEVASGVGYAEFIASRVTAPFGCAGTFVTGGAAPAVPGPVAAGYRDIGTGVTRLQRSPAYPLDTVGDGGVYAPLADLVRWHAALWGHEIVGEESLRLMRRRGRLDSGEAFAYGLGLQVEQDADGRTWVGHGGSWTDSTILMGRYVEDRTTVIVLSNEIMAPVERISRAAVALMRARA